MICFLLKKIFHIFLIIFKIYILLHNFPYDLAVVVDTGLEVTVYFDQKVLKGTAILQIEKIKSSVNEIILDNRKLVISNITFGSKLVVQLPQTVGDDTKCKIEIMYETSPDATSLQWLTAEQTAGDIHPYLFSQCQAIHARSMFPCQDTPSVKSSYSAKISVPKELTVVMSAILDKVSEHSDKKIYEFHQPVPIPSYLVAIAVGALVIINIRCKTCALKYYMK